MKKDATIITTLSLVGITILSGIILASSNTSADNDSTVDTTTITVPVSCTMSGNIATGQEHSATLQPGTYSGDSGSDYENGIGKTTLTTFCNDDNGFSIYAVGFTGDTMEGENHTKLVGTSASGNATIATKAYESSDTTSNWSMKVTKVENPSQGDPITYNPQNMSITNSFNSWHTIPDTYTKVAEYHATTGTSTTDTTLGAKVETTYAAYVSTSQPADTYAGKVKYTMVHPYAEEPLQPQPSTAGCITYYANASDSIGTMGTQCNVTDGSSVTLYASNFSRTGYGFAGWSDKFDYATNPQAHFYGPNETITVPTDTTANGLSLYAVWVESEGSLQDTSKVAALCSTGTGSLTQAPIDGTANLSSISALTDQRDNQTYAIAKLADGKCWMLENLRLENTASHNTDGSLAQGYNSSFIGLAAPEYSHFNDDNTANSLYSTNWTTDVTITGNDKGYRLPRYNNSNTLNRASNTTNTNTNTYSDGNYYTWHATIADTTYYSGGDHGTTSICPTGWRIPQGNSTAAGFRKLDIAMGGNGTNQSTTNASNRWRKYPTNFLYSGYFYGSSAITRGGCGYYWSSTASNNLSSYHLYLDSSKVYPSTNVTYKYYGYSIRCTVADS